MSEDKNLLYILSILESIEKIAIYSKEFENEDEFLWAFDQINFNASLNLLLAIGEESKKIDPSLKTKHQQINWIEIEGLRNRIAHDYRGLDPGIVWDIIKNYLPELKNALIDILKEIKFDRKILQKVVGSKYYLHLNYLLKLL